MKLEIRKVKSINAIDAEIQRSLKKAGWKACGSGAYGAVWKRGNRAIKLCSPSAYNDYLEKVVLPNQKNPWVPKVFQAIEYRQTGYKKKHWMRSDESLLCVEMEALQPLPWKFPKRGTEKVKLAYRMYKTIESVMDRSKLHPDHFWLADKKLMKILYGIEQVRAGGVDMHEGNFMIRNGSQLVITDPVA